MTTKPLDQAADTDGADDLAPEDSNDIWKELDAADHAKAAADAGEAPASDGAEPASDKDVDELQGWVVDGAIDPDPAAAADAGAPVPKPGDKPAERSPEDQALWESATPAQRAAYEALEQKFKSVNGRVAPLQRRYEELKAVVEAPVREKKSPKAALAALKDDYPEIAEPLMEALTPIEESLNEQNQVDTAAREAAQVEMNTLLEAEAARLAEVHPDWLETLGGNKDAFAAWVEDQPRRIRDAAKRNGEGIVDADQASEIVTLFKEHLTGEPPAGAADHQTQNNRNALNDRRQRQLGASASPTGKASARPLVSGIPEEGDPQAIWNGFEALDRQKAAANREYR